MAERFQIDQIIEILDADTEFTGRFGSLSVLEKERLSELLIDNNSAIALSTARELSEGSFLSTNISGFGIPSAKADLLQIYYTYKYAAVKIFFRELPY